MNRSLIYVLICNVYNIICNKYIYIYVYRLGISVSIATDLRVRQSGIESRWGRDFSAPVQTGPAAHPAPCTMGTGSFPGVKCGWGVLLTTHPLLVPRSWNSRAISLLPLWAVQPVQGLSACRRVHFKFILQTAATVKAVNPSKSN